eukprot:310122-Chlamydomonas_euryale.AAC.1
MLGFAGDKKHLCLLYASACYARLVMTRQVPSSCEFRRYPSCWSHLLVTPAGRGPGSPAASHQRRILAVHAAAPPPVTAAFPHPTPRTPHHVPRTP